MHQENILACHELKVLHVSDRCPIHFIFGSSDSIGILYTEIDGIAI